MAFFVSCKGLDCLDRTDIFFRLPKAQFAKECELPHLSASHALSLAVEDPVGDCEASARHVEVKDGHADPDNDGSD